MSEEKTKRPQMRRAPKRKVCKFCVEKINSITYIDLVKEIDNPKSRNLYTTEKGKILPRRTSGICAKHQRMLANAVKRARVMALMPYKAD